jgi:hypothetical protein
MLSGRIDEIDVVIDKIQRLIEHGSKDDAELGAGIATGTSMSAVQRSIDKACAAADELEGHVKDVVRGKR